MAFRVPTIRRPALAMRLAALALAGLLAGTSPGMAAGAFPGCLTDRDLGVAPERLGALARGFNLPGWLDRPDGIPPERSVLRHLRILGMTHIRLPVTGELVMAKFSDEGTITRHLTHLRAALDLLLDEGFAVSVDLHPGSHFAELYRDDSEAGALAVEDAWTRMAAVVAGYPKDRVFAEVLNEPVTTQDVWAEHLPRFLAHLRALLPETTLIAQPYGPQRPEVLLGMTPFDDPNIVYAVHFYDPMVFTHQGLTWSTDADPLTHLKGVPFPARRLDPKIRQMIVDLRAEGRASSAAVLDSALARDWNAQSADRLFDALRTWSDTNRRAVILNEFGVLRFEAAPDDRARWLAAVVTAAEARGCAAWTHWDYADGFGLLDPGTGLPDDLVMRALLDPGSIPQTVDADK
ncbi:glycoside hydrolase family 5 protein [Methylobrevis pamukkalensis]|uniref:Exo-1,3-beta-glucanase D n=1 Tax=Methylobrevis pamukkalensis TaxID=1439726 RepID=A0A1E3H4Z7_9HYPH|nr:cellulase family glycosylhydrolase [Methylobrevis pamukkalensis]ODN71380.1 Endoglucanase 3 precursor [Methylobrevis pamukkalensis]